MDSNLYRSATLKLTAWYMALVVVISLSFSIVVYHFAASELEHGLNTQSARIYQNFPVFDHNPFFQRDSDLREGEHHILWKLAEFNLVVLVAAGFASYGLAKRTLQPIKESHDRQKRFTADASHELRTPLTAIKMAAEVGLMDKSADKKELRAILASNIEESNKLDDLINNLLRLSRLEASELQQNFSGLNIYNLVEDAIAGVQPQATTKKITITNELKHKDSAQVLGDADSLVQLVVILLDNAVKYSPSGSGVEVTAKATDDSVELRVRDHGSGIEPAALQHVFDRFYRSDSARTHGYQNGYGLGLSIAKYIADLHKARLTLTSAVGKGTTAILLLPKASVEPPKA